MEMEPQLTEVNQKLEEVKLELETKDESPEKAEQMKRGSLKKFFRIKGLKSSSADDVSTDIGTSSKFKALTRVFSRHDKKPKDVEKAEGESSKELEPKDVENAEEDPSQEPKEVEKEEVAPRHSFIMRSLVSCRLAPWISHRPSQMNLQQPIEVPADDDDDDVHQEVATCSEIF